MLQDKLGFIWMGTDNGLNRFDGSNFKVYRNHPHNPSSISDNSIWSLFEDRSGNIWAGTKGGVLNKYIPALDKFERIKLNENKYTENSITSILEDSEGLIWVGTYSQGLFKYETKSGKITNWRYDPNNKKGLSNNYISSLLQDENGFIWISTYNGLNRLNPKNISGGFDIYFSSESKENSISNNLVWRISQSTVNKNLLWIGTANGLCTYELDKNKFTRIAIKPTYPLQFSKSFASVAEQNINGKDILWAATYGGLFKIDLNSNQSEQFIYDKKNPNSLLGNQIDQLLLDRSGVLWIATEKGVNYHSLKTQKFNNVYLKNIGNPLFPELYGSDIKSIIASGNDEFYLAASEALFYLKINKDQSLIKKFEELNNLNLWSLEKGNKDDLWIGTYGNGLIHFNLKTQKKEYIKIESPTFKTSAFNFIKSLHLSKNGFLWIGFWGGGLASLNTQTNEYKIWIQNEREKNSLSFNDVWTLHEDRFGRLWIGTNGGGLNLFVPSKNGEFLSWKFEEHNKNSLVSNSILTITEIPSSKENEAVIIIGTENGLSNVTVTNNPSNIYDVTLKFDNYLDATDLANRSLRAILRDSNGYLWLSGNTGIYRFNPRDISSTNFGYADGLFSNIFNSNSCAKSENGLMIFGTAKGPVIFNPDEIKLSEYKPNIVFTDFKVFDTSIKPDEDAAIDTNIALAKEIKLSYSENVFSFQFATLDYNSSESIQYAYIMEGFDKDWNFIGNRKFATYTNLNSGTYKFKVKSSNSDGVWNDNPIQILVTVNSPWWRTAWAYIAYLILILTGLLLIRKVELNKTKLQNELRFREIEAEKLRDIEKIKSRFFANLSHEFRTPLMLIKGPAEQLLTGKIKNPVEQVRLIQRNSEKLQKLIDQLLELTQLESSAIPLRAKEENLIVLLRGIVYSFASLAEQKKITLNFKSNLEEVFIWVDKDKLEKILNNILSNAFKFTPENGTILVAALKEMDNKKEFISISIKDSGIGIPKEKLEHVFDRFFQVDDSSRKEYSGSGIGLSLVRELVDLQRWKINVNSEIGVGTEFVIIIPTSEDYLDANQKITEENNSIKIIPNDEKKELVSDNINSKKISGLAINGFPESNLNDKKKTILIVEDSDDVQIYLKEILKEEYNIIIAENGVKGLDSALQFLPDLIISDVMMPKMDGIEFCSHIKSDWQTSHIPVILLTAKASSENKIEGLETGADDYVTKPFSFRELSARIKNLLDQREKLKQKFGKNVNYKPEDITPNKADQEFLQKATITIEKNISEPEFGSDQFAQEMFLSRSQLHRKLHAVTGQSTGEFIRTIRLKKAAGLILEKKFSLTQIALEVGFNSPSHFTKAFKQMFGCLPSEFINRSNS
jgi:signal transduction histidine kinase/DNA-binding response OmpR family regulator/streptogramin lyase